MTRLEEFRATSNAGLGDTTKHQIASAAAGAAVTGTAAMLMAMGAVTGPVGMAIAAFAGIAALIANSFQGCGQTCIAATRIVDQVEPYLKQNVSTYLQLATPRPKSAQIAAMQIFIDTWNGVVMACSDPGLSDAGVRCIGDRQRGGKWDWFSYYYDPIANDTNTYDDGVLSQTQSVVTSIGTSITNLFDTSNSSLPFIVIGLGVASWLLSSREK